MTAKKPKVTLEQIKAGDVKASEAIRQGVDLTKMIKQ